MLDRIVTVIRRSDNESLHVVAQELVCRVGDTIYVAAGGGETVFYDCEDVLLQEDHFYKQRPSELWH